MNIGLTGGIATGKSTVSAMFVEKGAQLIDADQVAREVVRPGHPVLERVVERFGQAILHSDGTLNRAKLGELVFNRPEERKALEEIMHPAIRKMMLERMEALESEYPGRLVVVDVPLLYESRIESYFEQVVVVYASEDVQLERMIKNRGMTREAAVKRLQAQLPIEVKKNKADVVIDNNGDLEATAEQVDQFLQEKGLLKA